MITGQVKSGKTWIDVGTYTVHVVVPKIDKTMIDVLSSRGWVSIRDVISNETLVPSKIVSSKQSVAIFDEEKDMLKVGYEYGTSKITAYFGSGKDAAKYKFTVRVKKGDKLDDPTAVLNSLKNNNSPE